MEGAEKTGWHTTSGSQEERATKPDNDRVLRIRLGGHRGTWATFVKIKQKYWWKNMYKDIAEFTESCEKCQIYSGVRHRDELHPTFSPTINFKWMVDIVAMRTGIGQKKYLVLAREDLTNQVEGWA